MQNLCRLFRQDSPGFGLIEAIISISLLGMIAVCALGAIGTSYKVVVLAREQVTAKSVARSQMEYVEQQEYIVADDGSEATYLKLDNSDIPQGYAIFSVDCNGMTNSSIKGVPWDPDPSIDLPTYSDQSLQKIMLVITYNEAELWTLDGFKVNQ